MPQLRFDSIPLVCSTDKPFLITQANVANELDGWGVFSGSAVSSNGIFEPARALVGSNKIQYSFKTQGGCSAEISRNIVVARSPRVDAGPDLLVRKNTSQTIKASVSGGNLTYKWSPAIGLSDPTVLQPVLRPHTDVLYTLTVTTQEGCTASDMMQVKAPAGVFIPNAFTPNGDGINDTWHIPFLMETDKAFIQVFNRDGVCVYSATNSANWNGKYKGTPMPIGTYVYMVKLEGDGQLYKGTLTLVR
jgi:gliding motility-associated-like protein